MGIDLQDPDET